MVRLTLQFIRGTRRSERIDFSTAREARSYLLQTEKQEQAKREGDGNDGKLVAGKGSAKRLVAVYSIEAV